MHFHMILYICFMFINLVYSISDRLNLLTFFHFSKPWAPDLVSIRKPQRTWEPPNTRIKSNNGQTWYNKNRRVEDGVLLITIIRWMNMVGLRNNVFFYVELYYLQIYFQPIIDKKQDDVGT